MIHKHPQPLRDFDYVGMYHYSLTWCCRERKCLFTQSDHVDLVRAQLLRTCTETSFALVAYCFMPDHLHQLVKGCTNSANGKQYIKLAKQYSGFYFKKQYGQLPFDRYGHDRFLREDKEVRTIVGYIIENPVRARLVEKVEDYPFTGSSLYSIKELMESAYNY
jgi:putative transposase